MNTSSKQTAFFAYSLFGRWRAGLAFACTCLVLAACALPDKPVRPVTFDLGPGAVSPVPAPAVRWPTVVLADIEAGAGLQTHGVLYRFGYADRQQPQPYALARWSAPPAQLVQQRLRERLSAQRTVLSVAQATALRPTTGAPLLVLRLDLEEFSQYFRSPQESSGSLRLRATATLATPQGEMLLAQRSFSLQRVAPQPDAAGGVQALAAATDAVIDELLQWLGTLQP